MVDDLPHRQARFGFGPLVGLLLANILSKSVVAKFTPSSAFKISYEPIPWTIHESGHNSWYPINEPHDPTLPPIVANSDTSEAQHIHHHHHISPPNQQQIVNINNNGRPPTEIIIDSDYDSTDMTGPDTTENSRLSTIIEENSYFESAKTNLESPRLYDEPVASESNTLRVKRPDETNTTSDLISKKSVKRGASRYNYRKRNNQQKLTRILQHAGIDLKKRTNQRRPVDSYEESTEEYEEYDSYELTTKPYKKKRRTTTTVKSKRTKPKNKKKPLTVIDDDDKQTDEAEPITQIIGIRPRQETTTLETMITNGTTTMTPPIYSSNITGYGYGPSNGNENISFTYGPPHGELQGTYGVPITSYGPPRPVYAHPVNGQYQVPFNNWYNTNEHAGNAVVKKVHDILDFDNYINHKDVIEQLKLKNKNRVRHNNANNQFIIFSKTLEEGGEVEN
ncbi:hypothetical protein NQ317_010999 [Molorchus minor]|uniref:Uncharacterized protein n=1 Tax=Molorchus minor TaxID=1323400 RepID=A0ABQ9K1M7_9CUCU|nr:hypothetical protein NQ317_010999 [Molorchus minor]